ncbi:hypothetical protein HWV23_02810 [Natronomonas halophila]|uniref:hypothetical protein n=1 Tax=Natronomonas halophila TaxID=2747817 RepID=UPI0015B678C0|nr:hypothetical protein [Natronomonas halophila]QLD84633.1 hypothetical protein HWV23_02535 [Natronomonas halophila]QLD84687.1 hypothetical protein HWV23_02810 [Natronomonas halophila]
MMRRFTTTSNESDSKFGIGLLTGVFVTLSCLAVIRVARWAMQNPVFDTVHTWATTPSIAPIDLLNVVPIAMLVLMIAMVNRL